jgi:hypothetical protein
MESAKEIKQVSEIFTISFAGTIYKWHPIQSFLSICNELVEEGILDHFELKLYGLNCPEEIQNLIHQKYPVLKNRTTIYPKMENELLVKKLADSNAFLLFNDYSILGTKIFTYLGLRRKILLCYSNDSKANILKQKHYNLEEFSTESNQLQEEIINETKSGIAIKNEVQLRETLIQLKSEFDLNGFISCNSINIEKYSRKKQAEKLASLIIKEKFIF